MKEFEAWEGELNPQSTIDRVEVIGEDVHCLDNGEVDVARIAQKLVKARTQLLLDKPFLGNLVLRLPLVAADNWCKTSATDAKNLYYNPAFVATLDSEQTKFVLIHEALHCALNHFSRRGRRKKHIWDLACDFAINPLIVKEGFAPPIEAPILFQYEGKTAEEIYPMIDDSIMDTEPMDQHLYDENANDDSTSATGQAEDANSSPDARPNSNSANNSAHTDGEQPQQDNNATGNSTAQLAPKPNALSHQEIEQLSIKWQKDLASSAVVARQAGQLSPIMEKIVDFYLQPQVNWTQLLAHYLNNFARDDFSYYRPKKRHNALLPMLKSSSIDIVIAVDTSGSITQEEVDEFITEINTIKSNLRANLTLLACDEQLSDNSPMHYAPWDELQFPESLGGGRGTNFTPVFNYIDALDTIPSCVVYFTDANGVFPEREPEYPVLWLVKGSTQIPWGQRCQLS